MSKEKLHQRIMENWNPDEIKHHMELQNQRTRILESWATNTNPEDTYRWNMRPDMNFLESKD